MPVLASSRRGGFYPRRGEMPIVVVASEGQGGDPSNDYCCLPPQLSGLDSKEEKSNNQIQPLEFVIPPAAPACSPWPKNCVWWSSLCLWYLWHLFSRRNLCCQFYSIEVLNLSRFTHVNGKNWFERFAVCKNWQFADLFVVSACVMVLACVVPVLACVMVLACVLWCNF